MKREYLYAVFLAFLVNQPAVLFSQSADKNYVLTRTMLDENGNAYMDNIQYYDGLGRPTQLVQKNVTPSGADLVSMQEYDAAGRVCRQWIATPFSGQGNYVDNFASEAPAKHGGDNYPYAQIQYDYSPLNRVVKETGPGSIWHSRGRGISTRYLTNTASGILSVVNYSMNSSSSLSVNGAYAAGQLYCTEITDEDGNIIYTFTDKQGRTVLTRQMNGTERHDTYYVYDDFGNLGYVLPPMVDGNISVDNLDKYAYRYTYDDRQRCIEVKLPGCEPIYQIYDKSDRLVLKQDGNQRARGVWLVNKYDRLGRLLYTSEVEVTTELDKLRQEFSGWLVTESFSTGAQEHPMEDTGYSRNFYHIASTTLLTVNYYDTYDFLDLLSDETRARLEYYPRSGFPVKYSDAKGLLTGSRTYSLKDGNGMYVTTAYYYDGHGNIVGKHSSNHMGGYDSHFYTYTFTGHKLRDWHEHESLWHTTYPEDYTYKYDHALRLTESNYAGMSQSLSTGFSYDELGRLTEKSLNGGMEEITYQYDIRDRLNRLASASLEESLAYQWSNISFTQFRIGNEPIQKGYLYSYDGLNRLTEAQYTSDNGSLTSLKDDYKVRIEEYDKNGNILQMKRYGRITAPRITPYIVGGGYYGLLDDLVCSYEGNRLKQISDISENTPFYKDAMDFVDGYDNDSEYTYDANGNMTSDKNKGIDNIIYNSLNLPNTVWMAKKIGWTIMPGVLVPATRSGLQPINPGGIIPLNYERPFIEEFYWADGRRYSTWYSLERSRNGLSFSLLQSRVDYSDNFIYENDTLSKVLIPDGYIDCKSRRPVAYFYLKDHQGNNRLVLNTSGEIVQINRYYPFGALWGESTEGQLQKYKYNGKELERMHGLDWYDYGARWMDAVLGRFTSVDPLCEKYYSISPYVYCNNNPVNFVDPDGKFFSTDVELNEDGTYEVVGGKADGDLNIYLTQNGRRTGDIIGRSLTEYSFLNDDGQAVKGAIINPRDKSGINFISNKIIKGNPNILYYMPNATKRGKYDFKRIEESDRLSDEDKLKYYYRGMPFNEDGIYASARDIGNWGAGYVAGKSGLTWGMARFGFDGLESAQNIARKGTWRWYIEGQPTQQAERAGYRNGQIMFNLRLLEMLTKFIK